MPFCILLLSFQYQELYARKPKEGEEDPVLVEEIRKARENVGMYTRKTSIEYDETTPIRFNHHKSQLIMLLQQVSFDFIGCYGSFPQKSSPLRFHEIF